MDEIKWPISEECFREWVRLYHPILVAQAKAKVGDEDADDVVQETLADLWVTLTDARRELRRPSSRTDLEQIAFRLLFRRIAALGSRRRLALSRRTSEEPDDLPATEPDPSEDLGLSELLEHLPPGQRKVAELRLAGHTIADIAAQLRISPRSVDRSLEIVRDRLATVFEVEESSPVESPESPPVTRTLEPIPVTALARSQTAYERELPELLRTHRGAWVAYADGERVRIAGTQAELYRHCLTDLGLTHDRFVVRRVVPPAGPHVEHNLR